MLLSLRFGPEITHNVDPGADLEQFVADIFEDVL